MLVIPDENSDAELAAYNQPGDIEEMRRKFQNYDETVTAMLQLAETCTKWTLAEVPPLPTWHSENHRVVLLGDACHGMTPHAAAGATMTLEDAEVLGHCVARHESLNDLTKAVTSYEHIRKARCERVQAMARENATTFSMPDGPEQQARDARMVRAKEILFQELEEGEELRIHRADMSKPFPVSDYPVDSALTDRYI